MMKCYAMAALLLLLCPEVEAQTDTTDVYKDMQLGELTVKAQRKLVKTQDDRISYDVTADPEAKTSPLIDMLKKVPFVTVESDGTIKVKGSTNFKIYRNGRPNQSFSSNAKDLFKGISASMVKRIEVITDPGAKYDAEGLVGILNIVMDQQSKMQGIMGTLSNYESLGRRGNPTNSNLFLTTQTGKLTIAPYFGIATQKWQQRQQTDYLYSDSKNQMHNNSLSKSPGHTMWYGVDASLELDTCNLFNLSASGFAYGIKSVGDANVRLEDVTGNTLYSYHQYSLDNNRYRYFDVDLQFSYQHNFKRKGELLAIDYLFSTTNSRNRGTTSLEDRTHFDDYDGWWANNHTKFYSHTLQMDYERPFNKHHTLSLGGKYTWRNNASDNVRDYYLAEHLKTTSATQFDHKTGIGAIYAEYKYRWQSITATAGLRYENSHVKGSWPDGSQDAFSRNFNDLVPSMRTTWQINDNNSLKLAYSMRISRPGISYLNPFRTETPTSLSYGNPDLGTAKAHNISLGYTLVGSKLTLSLNTSMRICNNAIASLRWTEGNRFVSTYGNNGHDRTFMFNPYVQWNITSTTKFTNSSTIEWDNISNPSLGLSIHRWQYSTYNQISQELPAKLTLTLQAYITQYGDINLYGYDGYYNDYGVKLQRSFLKNDRLTAYIHYSYGGNMSEHFTQGSYTGNNYIHMPHHSLGIGFSLRFGELKASVKKTSSKVSNDDLMGRK